MIFFPAIDLLDGRVVRLHKGDFGAVTDYGDDPVQVADAFKSAGADWVHVVDLSGARDGQRRQTGAIGLIESAGLKIQSGGGVRSEADIEALYEVGVTRVVIGSLAVTDPELVSGWISRFGGDRITLALDVNYVGGDYRPAVRGWTDVLTVSLDDVIESYAGAGVRNAMVTDIGRDGALDGPNTALYQSLVARYPDIAWQASGGVSSLADIAAVRQAGVAGVISGKAIYENRFSVAEGLACSRGE